MKEYKVIEVKEGILGTLLLGASSLPIKELEVTLNKEAEYGWECIFQVIEHKRTALFWARETIIVTLVREKP